MLIKRMTIGWYLSAGLTLAFVPPTLTIGQVIGLSGWNIYLDPGHSLTENMGVYGYSEAERNLGVALHLYDLLMTDTDIDTVYLSRDSQNDYISLSDRSTDANTWGAAWFHSLHSNAPSTTSNSVLLLWGQYYNGNEKVPNGGHAMSDIMAPLLAAGMRTSPWTSIGDCSFYTWSTWCQQSGGPYLSVNRNTTMSSELSESGFHTNPTQNQRNMNDKWKRLEAYTFYWSILQFHELARPPVSILTGIIKNKESGVPINGAVAVAGGLTDTTDTYESLFHKYSTNPEQLHNGFYFLEDVPADTVELIVTAPGYYPDTVQVAMANTFFTFQDVGLIAAPSPYLVASFPAQGDTGFPAWEDIMIEFSRPMDRASVEANFVIDPAVEGTISWSDGDRRMIFAHDTLAFETDYTLTVTGSAQDKYGNPFDGNRDGVGGDDWVLNFRTSPPDLAPPEIAAIYPPHAVQDIELTPLINITYDEQLADASVTDAIIKLERFIDQSAVPGLLEHYVVNDQSTLCFFPENELYPDEVYVTRVYPGLQDVFGNDVSGLWSFGFHTVDYTYDITGIDDFESDVTANWWQPSQSGSTGGIDPSSTNRGVSSTVVNHLTGSTQSLQLNYGWETTATSWLLREYLSGGTPRSVHFNSSYIMQAYVFGDGSGNQLRFCVDDNVNEIAASKHEVSPWYTIDWIGWKLVSWDMSVDGTGTWIGDGALDGTLEFDSIQLTYAPDGASSGTLYVDDLRIVQKRLLDTSPQPEKVILRPNYPNPFNTSTTIEYVVLRPTEITLSVYSLLGQQVKVLARGPVGLGYHKAIWNGKDRSGRSLPSGLYIYRLQAEGFSQSRKMVLTK